MNDILLTEVLFDPIKGSFNQALEVAAPRLFRVMHEESQRPPLSRASAVGIRRVCWEAVNAATTSTKKARMKL